MNSKGRNKTEKRGKQKKVEKNGFTSGTPTTSYLCRLVGGFFYSRTHATGDHQGENRTQDLFPTTVVFVDLAAEERLARFRAYDSSDSYDCCSPSPRRHKTQPSDVSNSFEDDRQKMERESVVSFSIPDPSPVLGIGANTGSGQEVLSTVSNRATPLQEYLTDISSNRSPTIGYGRRTELATLLAVEGRIDTQRSKEYEPLLNVLDGEPGVRQWADRASISEDFNPTTIVIKNIPFAVQKKGLPLPQALCCLFTSGFTGAPQRSHTSLLLKKRL